jgi:hypothetical protein
VSPSDVVHRGAVGGVDRRRRIIPLVLGVLVAAIGLAAIVLGVVRVVGEHSDSLQRAVGQASMPSGTVTFASSGGPFTIFLLTPGIENTTQVEAQVGAAVCEVRHPSGHTSTIRGSRQASSVVTDDASTIGWFTAEAGTTSVTCRYDRVAQDGRDFAVGPGTPDTSPEDVAALLGGTAALIAGGGVLAWAWRPRVVSTIPRP